MTVSSIIPVNNYTGNSSVKTFDFDFLIEKQEELQVVHTNSNGLLTTLEFGVDYSINEIGNKNGSYITFPLESSNFDVLSNEEIISLSLTLPIKQESEFENSANLNLSILERTFDYIIRILQIMNRKIDRSVKVNEGIGIKPEKLINKIEESENNSLVNANKSAVKSQEASESAELARLWAILLTGKVNNEDYSSKYYAQQSQTYSQQALSYANVASSQSNNVVNATNDAVARINAIDALKTCQLTNCLLEVPKRINYSISNGVLTIKAGSILLVPYGTNNLSSRYPAGAQFLNSNFVVVDTDYYNGKFFVYAKLLNNLSYTCALSSTVKHQLFLNINGFGVWFGATNVYSGDSKPASVTYNECLWYDTTNNLVKRTTDSGTNWQTTFTYSLPLLQGIFSAEAVYVDKSYDIMSYVDQHTVTHKGIVGLIPNGRNSDGSLNNKKLTSTHVYVKDESANASKICFFNGYYVSTYGVSNYYMQVTPPNNFAGNHAMWYDPNTNIMRATTDGGVSWEQRLSMYLGKLVKSIGGQITDYELNLPVRLLDYNEYKLRMDKETAYITETYANGASGYIVYSNGYCEQWGNVTVNRNTTVPVTLLKTYKDTNYNILCNFMSNTNMDDNVLPLIVSASSFNVYGTHKGSNDSWVNETACWRSFGYIS